MAVNPWAFRLNPISDTKKKTLPDSHKLSGKSRLFLCFPNYNFTQSCVVILQSSSSVTWKKRSVVTYNDNALKMAYNREWHFIAASCDKSGLRENIVCVLEIIAFKIKTSFSFPGAF